MVIFIDESGTHKQEGHSTMVVVYVEVADLEKFNKGIIDAEIEIKIDSFHWGDERWDIKEKFLSRILKLDFEVKVAIFENPAHPEKMLDIVFEHILTEPNIRALYLDGKKPRWYELSLKKRLRDKGISVAKLRTVNDRSQPGVQVADCMAGLIRWYYDNPAEELPKKWFLKLKKENKLRLQLLFGGTEK